MKTIFLICKSLLLATKLDSDEVHLYSNLILSNSYPCSDEGFIEPSPKKTKTSTSKPVPAASEASAPATSPAAQISTTSSLSKGKEIPSTAAVIASPPEKPVSLSCFDDMFISGSSRVGLHQIINFLTINPLFNNSHLFLLPQDLRAVISSLEAFASQYTSLETDKARLQKDIESSSSTLEGAIKIAAEARQNADSLKDELEKLKRKLRDNETSRLAAEAQMNEKDDLLRQSVLALLSNSHLAFFSSFPLSIQFIVNKLFLFVFCRSCQYPC
jgi:hypothetical protein